jgi:hypothetical protein
METPANLPAKAPGTSVCELQQSYRAKLRPTEPAAVTAHLTACLALVRPVGMSDADVGDWLRVAAREVGHLPPELLAEGCAAARRTCTHHSQIVPAIIRETEQRLAIWRKIAGPIVRDDILDVQERIAWQPTLDEIEAIKRQAAENLRA